MPHFKYRANVRASRNRRLFSRPGLMRHLALIGIACAAVVTNSASASTVQPSLGIGAAGVVDTVGRKAGVGLQLFGDVDVLLKAEVANGVHPLLDVGAAMNWCSLVAPRFEPRVGFGLSFDGSSMFPDGRRLQGAPPYRFSVGAGPSLSLGHDGIGAALTARFRLSVLGIELTGRVGGDPHISLVLQLDVVPLFQVLFGVFEVMQTG